MTPSNSVRYHPPTKPTFRQTILWFLAGTTGMFLIVSAIFAIKLGSEGRLPFFNTHNTAQTASRPARTADNATATPPIASQSAAESAAAPAASSSAKEFISGAEGILPPEAAHLAKVGIATEQPPLGAAPPAPPPQNIPSTQAAPTPPGGAATRPSPASETVEATVHAWASAWKRKDAAAYLKHYAPDFQPARGLSREEWIEQRRQRLAKPGDIDISIADIDIATNDDKANARFTQIYRSGPQKLSETKTLELALRDGAWLIVQERIGR